MHLAHAPQPWFDHPAHFPRHLWDRVVRADMEEAESFRHVPFELPRPKTA
jgi:hypothetical protein